MSEWGPSDLLCNLRYDPKTGLIFWGAKEVLKSLDRGYLKGRLGGKNWYAHRVAWLLHYGEWPRREVDHINGNRSDNRICNLRDVPAEINNRNKAKCRNSASGITGIYRTNRPSCWVPQVSVGNRSKALGATPCLGVAIKRRRAAEQALKFHKNHGRMS